MEGGREKEGREREKKKEGEKRKEKEIIKLGFTVHLQPHFK